MIVVGGRIAGPAPDQIRGPPQATERQIGIKRQGQIGHRALDQRPLVLVQLEPRLDGAGDALADGQGIGINPFKRRHHFLIDPLEIGIDDLPDAVRKGQPGDSRIEL